MEGTPKHSIDAFVGSNNEEALNSADEFYSKKFEDESESGIIEKYTSPERQEIEDFVIKAMPEFLKKYGLDSKPLPEGTSGFRSGDKSKLNIKRGHIQHLDPDDLDEEDKKSIVVYADKETIAGFSAFSQRIKIFEEDYFQDNISYARAVAHELIHFYAFQSKNIFTSDDETKSRAVTRRSGFSMGKFKDVSKDSLFNPDKTDVDFVDEYFNSVDEAITEELAIRFMRENWKSMPNIKSDLVARDKEMTESLEQLMFENSKPVSVIDEVTGKKYGSGALEFSTDLSQLYENERMNLRKLIGDIFSKNKDKLNSEEEVFEMMAQVAMNGRVLEFARIFETTYGKGSFRRLGEGTAYKKD